MAKKNLVTVNDVTRIENQFAEIRSQLTNPKGSNLNPKYVKQALQYIVDGDFVSRVRETVFKLIESFSFTVPVDFSESKELAKWNSAFNFKKAAYHLKPGDEFEVKFFSIKRFTLLQKCYKHLKLEEAILVGAPALSLLLEQHPEKFTPKYFAYISFDVWASLKKKYEGGTPVVDVHEEGIELKCGDFNNYSPNEGMVIVCFCKKESK